MNKELCGSHYHQAYVMHTHIVAQAQLLVVMCRTIWFVAYLVHHSSILFTRESALFEVGS